MLQLLLEGLQYLLQQIWCLLNSVTCITGIETDNLKDEMKLGILSLKDAVRFLGAFVKFQKENISFVISVCLSVCLCAVRMKQFGYH